MLPVLAALLSLSQPSQPPRFDGVIAAAADADMAATAYADGGLEPLGPGEGEDSLVLAAERRGALAELDRRPAGNSVISWPQIIEAVRERDLVFVVETRGALDRSIEQVEDAYSAFPYGAHFAAFVLRGGALVRLGGLDVGKNPQSVSRGPDGAWLLVATEADDAEAVFVRLGADGAPVEARPVDLDPPYREGGEARLRGLFWSPDGRHAAANVENERLQIYAVVYDRSGDPAGLEPAGAPVEIGRRWTVAKWTPDSRFLLAADTGWPGGGGLAMLVQGKGALTSLEVGPDGARVVSRVEPGLSVEGFALSEDGRRAVTVNMGRTYLPDNPLLRFWPGRNRSSLRLISIHPDTGVLTLEGPEVYFDGVLPEDAIFDADGDSLAVAVFHLRDGPGRRRGYIDLWRVSETEDGPRLSATGQRLETVRGPHDLVRLNE
ncbi:MAG: hypothetical protein ACFE0P_08315 [Oceanicaulis sp.]